MNISAANDPQLDVATDQHKHNEVRQRRADDRASQSIRDDKCQPIEGVDTPIVRRWLLIAFNIIVLGLAYGSLVLSFFEKQWSLPQYQYFPFVIIAFAWLLWRNIRTAESRTDASSRVLLNLPLAGLVAAWSLLAVAYLIPSPWLAIISALLLIGSLLLKMSQRWQIQYLWGLWIMLWLIVPLPLNRDQQLITGLQHLSSWLSSLLLDAVGVEHLMEGNSLHLPGKQFFVDEACSGIVSVLSIIACAVIYGIWLNRRPAHVVVLAACGVAWATLMNVGRITTVAVAYERVGIDWSTGTSHEVLGLVIFALVFLALVCTDLFLVGVLAPIEPTLVEVVGAPSRFGSSLIRLWDRLFSTTGRFPVKVQPVSVGAALPRLKQLMLGRTALVAFAVFPLYMVLGNWSADASSRQSVLIIGQLQARALACNQTTLPQQVNALRFAKFSSSERDRDDRLGNFSRTFEYHDVNGTTYMASFDFPYRGGWHELTVCYVGMGWELGERRVVRPAAAADSKSWSSLEAEFTRPSGDQGFLTASAFDEGGRPLELPTNSFWEDVWRRLTNGGIGPAPQVAFQVQVWVVSARPITDEQRATARNFLQLARQRFYEATIGATTADKS